MLRRWIVTSWVLKIRDVSCYYYSVPRILGGGGSRFGREDGKFTTNLFQENVISPQAAEAQIGDAPFPEVPAPDMHTHSPACFFRHACPGTFWQVVWAWQLGLCKVPLLPWAASSKYPEWEKQALNHNFKKCKMRRASLRPLQWVRMAAYSNACPSLRKRKAPLLRIKEKYDPLCRLSQSPK